MKITKFYIIRALTKVSFTRKIALFFSRLSNKETHIPLEESIFENVNVENINSEMLKKGYALGIKLPEHIREEILEFCKENETTIDFDKNRRIKISLDDESNPADGTVYKYRNSYKNCDAIKKIAHDPLVVSIAKKYLAVHPTFIGSQMWWSYPKLDKRNKKIETPLYGFHYDIDDLKFIKLFFYLNDVDLDRGPHVIIGKTHEKKDLFEIRNRRISDSIAQKRYRDQIQVIEGKSGTGFFEDTFCYHKGTHPNKRRLLLQFEYAVNDFANHDND